MKELQSIVNKHFDKLRHKKKYLAMVTALSMLVSFMVPLILTEPADSMTFKKVTLLANESSGKINVTDLSSNISENSKNMIPNAAGADGNKVGNITYNPEKMDVLALLFGGTVDENGKLIAQDIYKGCTDLESALEVDKETYFLGFASDFCAFIEGDFTATEADAEGRIAVGGNLSFKKNWNYQIGSGDYEVMSPLDEIEHCEDYRNIYGFASALVGGQMYRINTLSTGKKENNDKWGDTTRHTNAAGNTAYYHPDEGLYKYFLVANTDGFLHMDEVLETDGPYSDNCSHDYKENGCGTCTHSHLASVNELSQMYIYPDVRKLIQETFDYVRTRSEVLSHMQSIEGSVSVNSYKEKDGEIELDEQGNKIVNEYKLTFDAAGVAPNAKTVYFTLPQIDGKYWDVKYKVIDFKNIPEGANIVVNCPESQPVHISGGGDIKTTLNGVTISIREGNDDAYKKKDGLDRNANNHPDSSRILYNFFNATELHINGSFNGTVLCPNADVKSNEDPCPGHLSGALIAKSFYGGLEFGYRPYRGSSDIFGMSSGYEVPVDKFITGSNKYLPGAMFDIVELVEDENHTFGENIVGLFESSGKTDFISLPSHIDYSGNTLYQYEKIEGKESTKEETETGTAIDLVSPLNITVNDQPLSSLATTKFNVGDTIVFRADQKVDWKQLDNNNTSCQVDENNNTLTVKIKPSNSLEERTIECGARIKGTNGEYTNFSFKVNPIKFDVSHSEYTIGDEVKLSVSSVSNITVNDQNGVVIKYKFNNTEYSPNNNNGDYTFKPTVVGESIQVDAIITFDNTSAIITKYIKGKAPTMVFKVLPESQSNTYTYGGNVTLSVAGAPADATVHYYFNDNNNYVVGTVDNEGNSSYTIENVTQIGDSIPVKWIVYLGETNQSNIIGSHETKVSVKLPEMSIVAKVDGNEIASGSTVDVGKQVNLSVLNAPQNTQIQYSVQRSYDNVQNEHVSTNNSSFMADRSGTYTINASVRINGSENKLEKTIYVQSTKDENTTTTTTTTTTAMMITVESSPPASSSAAFVFTCK